MKEYQNVIEEVSMLKKPFWYYLYLSWRLFITVTCCIALLGVVGAIVYLGIEKGWFDGIFESPVVYIFVFFVPIIIVVGSVVRGITAIWKWGVTRKIRDWRSKYYYHSDGKIGDSGYNFAIFSITNKFYDKWDSLVKEENTGFDWLKGWDKITVKLPYHRKYPTGETRIGKVDIPLYYKDFYYTKEDTHQIVSELEIEDGEILMNDIINPTFSTANNYIAFVTEHFSDCSISRLNNDTRSTIVTKDGMQTIVLLAQYSSLNDIEDICTPEFLESLIPSKKLSIVALGKEYIKEEFELECKRRRNAVLFNERFEKILHRLESWRQLLGYPYYYFYNYYPSNMAHIGYKDKEIREWIYDFKSSSPSNRAKAGEFKIKYSHSSSYLPIASQKKQYCKYQDAYDKAVKLVSKKTSDTFGCNAGSQVSFVCVPADSEVTTRNRLEAFYGLVCERTGMDNAFQYVKGISDELPKHMGGKGLLAIDLDKSYFAGKKVVVFDDIVTHGTTMSKMIDALNKCGATVLFIISLAKTTTIISEHPINLDSVNNK